MRKHTRRSSKRVAEEPMINITPLIDVVFVILIMFIVIAPLLEIDQIELADASTNKTEKTTSLQESSPISIYVSADNKITFNNQMISLNELPQLLTYARKQHPDAKPQIFHDKKAYFGVYQSIKNTVESAGFSQMDIVLNPG